MSSVINIRPSFTITHVSNTFTSNELHKAKALANSGSVRISSFDTYQGNPPGYSITSTVIGSRRMAYDQDIQLHREGDRWHGGQLRMPHGI